MTIQKYERVWKYLWVKTFLWWHTRLYKLCTVLKEKISNQINYKIYIHISVYKEMNSAQK